MAPHVDVVVGTNLICLGAAESGGGDRLSLSFPRGQSGLIEIVTPLA